MRSKESPRRTFVQPWTRPCTTLRLSETRFVRGGHTFLASLSGCSRSDFCLQSRLSLSFSSFIVNPLLFRTPFPLPLIQGEKKGKVIGEEEGSLTKHGAHVNMQLRAAELSYCAYMQKSIAVKEKRQVRWRPLARGRRGREELGLPCVSILLVGFSIGALYIPFCAADALHPGAHGAVRGTAGAYGALHVGVYKRNARHICVARRD